MVIYHPLILSMKYQIIQYVNIILQKKNVKLSIKLLMKKIEKYYLIKIIFSGVGIELINELNIKLKDIRKKIE